jgi:GT2 family glycosyltransferase
VLIPDAVARAVGNLDPLFEHAMGDTDYLLRVRRAGFAVFVAPGVVGYCSHNPVNGTFVDAELSFRQRWKMIMHRKGLPPRSWFHFTSRHGGMLWPIYFAWPYTRVMVDSLRRLKI